MIVDEFDTAFSGERSRISCSVRFEGGQQRVERVFVETEGSPAAANDANAFLLAVFLPAWSSREHRIRIEPPMCPVLVANLQVAAGVLRSWYPELRDPPIIEADLAYRDAVGDAAVFLSGGVDSIATLRALTTMLRSDDPDQPRSGVLIDYQDLRGVSQLQTDARFAVRREACSRLCDDAGLRLVAVRTNLRRLNNDIQFWIYQYHGALLAAAAHAPGRFRKVTIAATYDAANLGPWGSHPALDPLYSSHHVAIGHHGVELSRLAKLRMIADWDAALDVMHVCTVKTDDGTNCGSCEKCLRTKLGLLVIGKLPTAGAFRESDVMAADLAELRISSPYVAACYAEMLPLLVEMPRPDLANTVGQALARYRRARSRKINGLVAVPLRLLKKIGKRALNHNPFSGRLRS